MNKHGILIAGLFFLANPVLAGRPLVIDDADPVAAGTMELEAGAAYEYDSTCKHWDFPSGLTLGLAEDLEVGIGFGGQLEERIETFDDNYAGKCTRAHGLGDLTLGAKWRFTESCPFARHALAPSVKFPTADEDKGLGNGKTDFDLTWIGSRPLGRKSGIHLNLGYSWIGGPDDDLLHYGAAFDCQLTSSVQWVAEVFVESRLTSAGRTLLEYNTGFRLAATESLTLDAAAGSNISSTAPDFSTTIGLTWAFGLTK